MSRAEVSNVNYANWCISQHAGDDGFHLHLPREVQAAIHKVSMRGATRGDHHRCFAKQDYKGSPQLGPPRRLRSGHHLSIGDKIEIVHEVLVGHRLQRDVAAAYQITPARVCSLCKRAEKDRSFLREMMEARELGERRRQSIGQKIIEMNEHNVFVDSADSVQKALKEDLKVHATH